MVKLATNKSRRELKLIVALLLIHLVLLFNLKFTAWPEMQLWPFLILKGWLPYRDIAIAHNPVLLLDLSIFNFLFGAGLWPLKIYTWITILCLDGLVYWVAQKIWDKKVALFALAFYLPFQLYYEGNGLWFDLTLALVSLASYYFLTKKKYLKAGIFWALAFFVKQTAVWFLIPVAIYILQDTPYKNFINKITKFSAGILIVALPILLIIWFLGILPEYLFWAYKFGIGILPKAPGQVSFPGLAHVAQTLIPLGLLIFLVRDFSDIKKTNLLTWALAGFMGTFPRWELFHFQPAVPFLAIGASLVICKVKKFSFVAKTSVFLISIGSIILIGRFLIMDWGRQTRFFERNILAVANYITKEVQEDERIFVVNTWDSLYAMTDTLPAAKPWVPQLPWYLSLPQVEERMVASLVDSMPEMIILSPYTQTGLSSFKPPLVADFIEANYQVVDEVGNHLIYKPK